MELKDELQRGILATGIDCFTPMQTQAIRIVQNGYDVIVQSTFGLSEHIILSTSVLQKINPSLNAIQAIILSPTHEMAREVRIYINGLGRFMNVVCQVISSETNKQRDMKSLDAGCHIVISTPSRFLRLIDDQINLTNIEIVVLSEYDQQCSHIYEKISGKLNKVIRRLYFVDNIDKLSSNMFVESMKIISNSKRSHTSKTLEESLETLKEDGEVSSENEETALKVTESNQNCQSSVKEVGAKEEMSFDVEDSALKCMEKGSNDKSCVNENNGTKNNTSISGHYSRRKLYELSAKELNGKSNIDRKSGLPLWEKTGETFEAIGIIDCLLKGIYEFGFETPTPMQQKSILAILNENEVVAESITPSGKTVSFVIALIHKLESMKYFSRAMVIVQNPRAAAAISRLFSQLAKYSRISCVDCGEEKDALGMRVLIKSFNRKVNVVIGDSYQIYYLVFMKVFDIKKITAIVVDDADKLFAEGNFDQISKTFRLLSRNIQRVFLCRKMYNEISEYIRKLSTKLVKVLMESDIDVNNFKHFYVNAKREELKLKNLCKIYDVLELKKALIYCNSEFKAIELRRQLKRKGYQVIEIENRLSRMSSVVNEVDLKADKTAVVVSDCYSRDSDLDIELIINYELPQFYETYKERLGGRLSSINIVISLVSGFEAKGVLYIQKLYNIEIREMHINDPDMLY